MPCRNDDFLCFKNCNSASFDQVRLAAGVVPRRAAPVQRFSICVVASQYFIRYNFVGADHPTAGGGGNVVEQGSKNWESYGGFSLKVPVQQANAKGPVFIAPRTSKPYSLKTEDTYLGYLYHSTRSRSCTHPSWS